VSHVFRRPTDYRVKPSPLFLLLAIASAANGTADITITPTGTLGGSGSLAGTCSIGLTAEAASTGGNLSGTAAGVFGAAATLNAGSAAAGVCALTFSNSAAPSGDVAYPISQRKSVRRWAQPPYDFTSYQQRMVIMSLATETGIFGQADIIFTPTATLRATGALAGAAGATFGGTGTLRGSGAFAGSSDIAFTPEGDLDDTPTGDLAGASSLVFDGSADIVATGAFFGASANTVVAAASLGSQQPIQGTTALTFSVSGVIGSELVGINTPRSRTVLVQNRRRR